MGRTSCRWLASGALSFAMVLGCSAPPATRSIGACQFPDGSFKPAGTSCRAPEGACDVEEVCTGASAECPDDAFLAAGTECRGAAGACDVAEACTGSSAACPADLVRDAGQVCRGSAGPCDVAESCTGHAPACPEDTFLPESSVCRASAGVCDVAETCSGRDAACPADAFLTSVCRSAADACDAEERCSGESAACPEDAYLPPDSLCRAASGTCDVEELCTGSSAACPVDDFLPASAVCRASAGSCDAEERCTGDAPECPQDNFLPSATRCRASAGVCDAEESCSGSSADCPPDGFLDASSVCRASAGACDVEERCSGSGVSCPADTFFSATTVCRASAGDCDAEELCTGNAAACPVDEFLSASTVCRNAAGVCDVQELCSGHSASCPGDAYVSAGEVCRVAAGVCDRAEACTGHSAACPGDEFLPASAVCRASAGACDAEESCTGSSPSCPGDGFLSSSTVCRPSAGVCDVAESCPGNSASCPRDEFKASSFVCRAAAQPCDATETCSGSSARCPADGFLAAGSVCSVNGGNACDGAGSCVVCANLCQQQTQCPGSATTRITGTVYMPNGSDPLPNTLVYVPNGPLQPLENGVQSCQPCSTLISGSPLVSAVTDAAGHFTITNMPVGTHIPLVIQNGKWRRQFELPVVTACVDTPVTQQLRMPSNQTEGDMPKIALVTGGFGALECVLLKMGISASEFGNGSPTSDRRVQFYVSDGNPGAHYDNATPVEGELWGTQATLNKYDLVFFGCEGSLYPRTSAAQQAVLRYANAGGQLIINHYALEWLRIQPFWGTANWNVGQPEIFDSNPEPAFIDTSFPKGQLLAEWLQLTNPTGVLGQVPLYLLYADFDGVVAPSQLWMSLHDSHHPNPVPMQYTFDTPVGLPPAQQCGRVMYNGYHTMEHFPSETLFPSACSSSPLRADERLMEFMLFDQGSCR